MADRSSGTSIDYTSGKAKLFLQYGGKDKYYAAKKARDDAKKKYTKSLKPYEDSNKQLLNLLNAPTFGYYAQLNLLKQQGADTAAVEKKIDETRAKISENNLAIYRYNLAIKTAQEKFEKAKVGAGGNSDNGGNDNGTPPKPGKGPWYFNAPLVSDAYFSNTSTLPKMLPAGPSSGNALEFWTKKENMGGKGAFQMDRLTNTLELKANAKKEAAKKDLPFDDKMYGFKFHYNPTTVNMSWSGMMGANPVYEAAGLDPAVPMATNLFTGTVSFDIILNRIQDLALLNADGSFITGSNPYGETSVSEADRKMIYQKGTMYDLEYLFRTLHGYAFYTNFKSNLMGSTNDPGWLPVRPVELHLGSKLRYRVRVSGLEVVHKIFSAKMVPLLSVVTITCMRYWDGPTQKDTKK